MFFKKRKARKAEKNSAVVAAMAMAEKVNDLNIPEHADMLAEKLTGKKKSHEEGSQGHLENRTQSSKGIGTHQAQRR